MPLKIWDEIKTPDDLNEILGPEEKKIIKELEIENSKKCPYLRKIGEFWYFCGYKLKDEELEGEEIGPFHPIFQRACSIAQLSLHCLGDFESCCVYLELIKPYEIPKK